jgi:hypothetical protein
MFLGKSMPALCHGVEANKTHGNFFVEIISTTDNNLPDNNLLFNYLLTTTSVLRLSCKKPKLQS